MSRKRTNKGFVLLIVLIYVMIFVSISMMIVILNKQKNDVNVKNIIQINKKIKLEQMALNVVGHLNVERMISNEYKKRTNYYYKINSYKDNYIIYVKSDEYENIIYYMVFNNYQSNSQIERFKIFEEGYLRGDETELES